MSSRISKEKKKLEKSDLEENLGEGSSPIFEAQVLQKEKTSTRLCFGMLTTMSTFVRGMVSEFLNSKYKTDT